MTIAFDARFLFPGGVHPHSRLVHIFLQQNARKVYPVRVLLYTDPDGVTRGLGQRYAAANVEVKAFGSSKNRIQRLTWLWSGLPQMLRQDAVDVFYSSFYFLPPRVKGKRLINTIHDCCVFYIPPKLNRGLLASPWYLWILKRYMNWTNRRASRTLTVSNFSRTMLSRHLGIRSEDIVVCYHGLDHYLTESGNGQGVSTKKVSHEPYFLFVGSNLPKKNIKQCLEGFARLPHEVRGTHKLRLKTNCFSEDRATIDRLGLGDRVEFIDRRLDEAEARALFENASLLLLLSYDEGFGLPIIEAFAADVPVLASNRAACDELVTLKECKADPDDTDEIATKWAALVSDQVLRSRVIAEQRRLLPQFSSKTAADRFYHALTA